MNKILFIVIAASFILSACGNSSNNRGFVRSVKTVKPSLVDSIAVRSFPGVVKETQKINVGFKTPGQITQIYVKEGDYIKEGNIVARLDDKDYKLQVAATQIQFDQLASEIKRLEELHRRNSLSGNDYEKAVAGFEALGVQLQSHKNTLEYTVLKAPLSGYVQSVSFRAGEMVDAGMAVISLLDLSSVSIETDIPLSLFLEKEQFGKIWCTSNVFPDMKFPLKYIGINRKSGGNQLYKMHLVSDSKEPVKLVAGMNVEIAIEVNCPDVKTGYILPMNAVVSENDRNYVWVLSPDTTVSRREITIKGIDSDGNFIIGSGISGNEDIVYAGVGVLQQNEKVRVISAPSKSNMGGLL
ncbi:MAG: efflux RND transporter periplasmic adaptor subunit [Bacteroidales bacterium]|jgi:RND family efflux transporter MFP subunit|nr:efflux RND transporter periplasmic adaptor subunit [Bacteroidales bacterium]